eukprot:7390629-Prymnesium_polylepis.1
MLRTSSALRKARGSIFSRTCRRGRARSRLSASVVADITCLARLSNQLPRISRTGGGLLACDRRRLNSVSALK